MIEIWKGSKDLCLQSTQTDSMNSLPKISIIIAVWNGSKTIERTLLSLRSQTFKDFEVVIKDANSTDGTMNIVQKFDDLPGARIVGKDGGIFDAWNIAVKAARGEWICFLGADDYLWNDRVLETFVKHLEGAYPKHRYVYGVERIVSSTGRILESFGEPWEKVGHRQRYENVVPHRGMMHHRTLFEDHGPFDTSFRIAGDYEFLRRELLTRPPLFIPGFEVVGGEWGGVSTNSEYIVKTAAETKRAVDKQEGTNLIWQSHWKLAKARIKYAVRRASGEGAMRWVTNTYRVLTGRPSRGEDF
jgi:glycosyltransferase involved in cell wall biosynthesis